MFQNVIDIIGSSSTEFRVYRFLKFCRNITKAELSWLECGPIDNILQRIRLRRWERSDVRGKTRLPLFIRKSNNRCHFVTRARSKLRRLVNILAARDKYMETVSNVSHYPLFVLPPSETPVSWSRITFSAVTARCVWCSSCLRRYRPDRCGKQMVCYAQVVVYISFILYVYAICLYQFNLLCLVYFSFIKDCNFACLDKVLYIFWCRN